MIDMDMDSEGVRKETVIETTKVEGENYSELTAKSNDFFNAYPWLHSSILKKEPVLSFIYIVTYLLTYKRTSDCEKAYIQQYTRIMLIALNTIKIFC